MKKVIQFLIMAGVVLACLSVKASASEPGEYFISESDGLYILTEAGESSSFDTLGECLNSISSPSSIIFSDVSVCAPITLPRGEYVISGDLYSEGIISLPQGAKVKMDGFSLRTGSEAYLRIKGGELVFESSSLYGSGELIRLDYSASSYLEVRSGVICGEYRDALINIENGRAVICGADIENKGGAAIRNDSELCLSSSPNISGATYGIILEAPMYMSRDAEEYFSLSPLSVQYMDVFVTGTLTEIFYEASERSLSSVTLYDKNGKQESITYFESTPHTSEQRFGGVYLPHTVRFYVDNQLVAEQQLLSGEKIAPITAPDMLGYSFNNWYLDHSAEAAYSMDKRVYSSFSLYGIYDLESPAFSISSQNFTYDAKERILAFDSLSHPLEGGYYTYKWYKDGEEISTLSRLSLCAVKDSGTYSCLVTYHVSGNSASVFADNIKINIEKQLLEPPVIENLRYNGSYRTPTVAPCNLYTVQISAGKDTGSYPIVFTLSDPENYGWYASSDPTLTLYYQILKAENAWISPPSASDIYVGCELEIIAAPLFGEVTFLYCATEGGVYTKDAPTSAGKYYVKAAVAESDNYSALLSPPIPFNILAEEVVGLELAAPPAKTEYCAFEQFEPQGMEIYAVYNSGRRELISSSRLKISYNDGKSLRVGDMSVVAEYSGASLPVCVSVSPLCYDLSAITFSDESIVYDGAYHTIAFPDTVIVGSDGIPLTVKINGGGSDAGAYTVTASFTTESRDYIAPAPITATLTVSPRPVELIWDGSDFVYDSTPKLPSASFIDVMGVSRDVVVCGSAIMAADGYQASALPYSTNYVFTNPTFEFSIAKADYDITSVRWTESTLTYTGDFLEVTLSGLPEGVSVAGYTDNRAVNTGKYTATASLKYDERNYNQPGISPYQWEIVPAEYDLSGFAFKDAEYEYSGEERFPILDGALPIGLDGIGLTYSFSRGAINVSDGEVSVIISFATESKNYITPAPMVAKVKILPKGIYVIWTSSDFTYDANPKCPTAQSLESQITVSGSAVNAGSYIATAASKDPNYRIVNSTYNYEIKKAENYWVSPPTIEDFFESRSPSPNATSHYGYPEYRYYKDQSLTHEITPTSPGEYYMVATVAESQNYLPLISDPIRVVCIEVMPIGISVEIDKALYAFSDIREGISVYMNYNDGSVEPIPSDTVTVRYQSADSLRCADTECYISYAGFDMSVSVSVNPASYDTSSVIWINTEVEYDGTPHSPLLTGLPDGISVIEYIGEPGVGAGEYIFSAGLSYDESNYLPPNIPEGKLTVKKATVPTVGDVTVEYSGEPVDLPTHELYTHTNYEQIQNSGEYEITYHLTDSKNYIFDNGSDTCQIKVVVTPRPVRVVVSDFTLYLFESNIAPTSEIYGEIADGDSLDLYYYLDGDMIYAGADNINYVLTVECGRLDRVYYPGKKMRENITVSALVLALLLLVFITVFKRRGDILDIFSALRSRMKNRKKCANAPSVQKSSRVIKQRNTSVTIYENGTKDIVIQQREEGAVAKDDKPPCGNGEDKEIKSGPAVISLPPHITDIDLPISSAMDITLKLPKSSIPRVTSENIEKLMSSFTESSKMPHRIIRNAQKEDAVSTDDAISGASSPNDNAISEVSFKKDKSTSISSSVEDDFKSELSSFSESAENIEHSHNDIPETRIYYAKNNYGTDVDMVPSSIDVNTDSLDNTDTDSLLDMDNEPLLGTDSESLLDVEMDTTEMLLGISSDEDICNTTADAEISDSKSDSDIQQSENIKDDEAESFAEEYTACAEASDIEEPRIEIKKEYADAAITDTLARNLIKEEREVIYTSGKSKSIINVDTLSRNFIDDDRVDVNILKKKSLVPYDTNYIKVLARGAIDKPLHVFANEFSLSAVKMILLSGGEVIRVISEKEQKNKNK